MCCDNINYEFYEPLLVWVWVLELMLLVVYQGVAAGGRIVIKKISNINYEFYEPLPVWVWVWELMLLVVYQGVACVDSSQQGIEFILSEVSSALHV